ncbi:uncharacterized protein LOC111369155 [Olea europaea var. sylvestris]|uniref:uncharacterized protein LOC111369155 n=1 Tax=Olea europaea var. sylvestris TaxID=158386 RepID=UPI000C1D07FA|nr:uncharacterized protein LOC111369155 [Olea europaea var. sylvestris]
MEPEYQYLNGLLKYKSRMYIGTGGGIRKKLIAAIHSLQEGGIQEYRLPTSGSKNVIFVVVDKFTKYAHFLTLSHTFTAPTIAKLFLDNIYKLHGMPHSIVEILNQCLEMYLRCMVYKQPKQWIKWISLAECCLIWYQTPKLALGPYQQTNIASVEDILQERQKIDKMLKENLAQANARMKHYAYQHRSEKEFQVGNWVYLKLHPYAQQTVTRRSNEKLSVKYYGPYKVVQKVGKVAYKLKLPAASQIHPIFHVPLLKKKIGEKEVPTGYSKGEGCYGDGTKREEQPSWGGKGKRSTRPMKKEEDEVKI